MHRIAPPFRGHDLMEERKEVKKEGTKKDRMIERMDGWMNWQR